MVSYVVKGEGLRKVFESGLVLRRRITAVDGVDVEIGKGETLALVGESGSGKSTLGRLLLRLIEPTGGRILFDGVDITRIGKKKLRKIRRKMQLIPQHPEDALDPRWKMYDCIAEPLRLHNLVDKAEEKEVVSRLLEMVGLQEEHLSRYPHELSGGELQRVVIARAISLNPLFIVCDEPTSMLDVSVQASILNLLVDLQHRFRLSYLFITHDLEVADTISRRIAVMYRGQIVEEGFKILDEPLHPYTEMLVRSVEMDKAVQELEMLKLLNLNNFQNAHQSQGKCGFYHLCGKRMDRCWKQPEIVELSKKRKVRCWLYQ